MRAPNLVTVRCEGVGKSFALVDGAAGWRVILGLDATERFQALSDVTLTVPKGEFVGILGRNGAGKSTLLRTIGGLYRPDQGRIRVAGELSGLYELGVVGNAELTGREYARRFLTVGGGTHGVALARLLDEVKEFSELDDRFDDCVVTYSSGMTARLFFAVATAEDHDVYLIDEILAVGDRHFQSKCWARIRERLGQGASGLLVTHDWSAVIKLCREAYLLEGGRVAFSGPADRVVRHYLDGDAPPIPDTAIAGFDEGLPDLVSWRGGEDAQVAVPVCIRQRRPISLRLSIERLSVGIGWEIILMSRGATFIGDRPGRYVVDVSVPALPLGPGRYILNLFVNIEPGFGEKERINLDNRSWLSGNGIELEVDGEPGGAMLHLPATWQLVPAGTYQ